MKVHLTYLIIFLCSTSSLSQNKGFKNTKSETITYIPNKITNINLDLQGAHIKITHWEKYEIEVYIVKEVSHPHNQAIVDKEESYLKVYKTQTKNNLNISNNIVLPNNVKAKPQAKHVTYVEIKLPNIDFINIDINVGSIVINNMNIKSSIKAVLCKSTINNSIIQGTFRQKLGDLKIIKSKLSGPFYLDYVVVNLTDIYGKNIFNANDSKILLTGNLENLDGTWQLNRSELTYLTIKDDILELSLSLKGTELTLPSFLPSQTNKNSYKIIPKTIKGKLEIKASNSFINIYNN
jgi:hypothetical protein